MVRLHIIEGVAAVNLAPPGSGRLSNGDLLKAAAEAGFEVFVTADKSVRYQKNLSKRKIALVVLGNSPWPLVRLHIVEIVAAVNLAPPGSYVEVDVPLPPKKPFTKS